jgi:uncharacterized membrane protein YkvA (DUF1232 family)
LKKGVWMKRFMVVAACVLYVVSPIDLLPEAILVPFRLPDDFVAAFIGFRELLKR